MPRPLQTLNGSPLLANGAASDDDDGESVSVQDQRGQQLEVTAVARDDLDVLSPATGVCLGRDDDINARRRRSESGSDRFLAQRTGRMPELLVHVGDVREFQESTDVIVVADVTGQDPFREHCGGNDQIRGVRSQHPQPRPSLLVQRRDAFDAASVEYDDQPAALCALDDPSKGPPRLDPSRGRTGRADANHSFASAISFADGAPWMASSSSSQASS